MSKESKLMGKELLAVFLISALAFAFLIWLIYFNRGVTSQGHWAKHLSPLNAFFNALSATALSFGICAIKKGDIKNHKRLMITAFVFSALFLVGYILYHFYVGETKFQGQGIIRPIYFFILITHIVLSAVSLPMILGSFTFGILGKIQQHKKLARWTWPIWLYVSVTGVLVFIFLQFFNIGVV